MSALGSSLLRAAKSEPVPNGAEERALAKLGVIAPVIPEPRVVIRKASRIGPSLAPIALSIVGSAVVAALLFANYTHSTNAPRHPSTFERVEHVERIESAAPSAQAVVAPSVAPSPPKLPVAPTPFAPPAAQPMPPPSARAVDSAKNDSLRLELTLVRQAKKHLEEGDPSDAIAALDRYAARYPDGTFAQEAAAVRVEALFALDDPATAVRAARLFFERYPASPYGRRIEALLRANR